jgi:hypothetical protein
MAKKSEFGNYTMSGIGKVFGGKSSARSRRQKRKDDLFGGSILLPALAVVGYFLYVRKSKGESQTETFDPNKNVVVKR